MTDIPKHRVPRSDAAATAMLERFAELQDAIGAAEGERNAAIAAANARIDPIVAPLVQERDDIAAKLEPWWLAGGVKLLDGKRKSLVLGGCEIGTALSRPSLVIAGEEADVIDMLTTFRWAKPFLRTKVSIDKTGVLKAIDGPRKAVFAELGLSRREPEDLFYVKRAEQEGTVGRSR